MAIDRSPEIGRGAGQRGDPIGADRSGEHPGLLEQLGAELAIGVVAGGPGGANHQRRIGAPAQKLEHPAGRHGAVSSTLE